MKRWGLIAFLLGWAHTVVAADVPVVLYWSQRVELSPPVSGIVQTVNVEAGQQVKKGQVLLSLDNVAFQAISRILDAHISHRHGFVVHGKLQICQQYLKKPRHDFKAPLVMGF